MPLTFHTLTIAPRATFCAILLLLPLCEYFPVAFKRRCAHFSHTGSTHNCCLMFVCGGRVPQTGSGSDINAAVLHCISSVSRRKSQAALSCATLRCSSLLFVAFSTCCAVTNPAISRSRHLLTVEAVEYHHKRFFLYLSLSTVNVQQQ